MEIVVEFLSEKTWTSWDCKRMLLKLSCSVRDFPIPVITTGMGSRSQNEYLSISFTVIIILIPGIPSVFPYSWEIMGNNNCSAHCDYQMQHNCPQTPSTMLTRISTSSREFVFMPKCRKQLECRKLTMRGFPVGRPFCQNSCLVRLKNCHWLLELPHFLPMAVSDINSF